MQSSKYKQLLWEFIAALDTAKYDTLTFQEVYGQVEAGRIQTFLADRFGSDLDMTFLEPQDWTELSHAWADIANAVDGKRKFGVEKKGMCLLLAYALESLQRSLREEKRL